MRCVHLINRQGSVSTHNIAAAALLPHSVSHEKCLVRLLRSEPKIDTKLAIKLFKYTYIPLILYVGDWLWAPLKLFCVYWARPSAASGLLVIACLSIPPLKLDIMSANRAWAVDSVLFFCILFICSKYFLVAGLSLLLNPSCACVYKGLASDLDT